MRVILILGFVSFLTDVSSEMVYPLLPLYLTGRLGASPAIVGVIEGIAESLASLLKVFSGFYSDRIGRRKPLAVLGYVSAGIGKFFLYISTSWTGVLVGRVVDRFGKGIRTAPRDALIAESAEKDELGRAFGLHRALDTLGAVMGIALAYFLFAGGSSDYSRIFLYSLIPATLGVLLLLTVREGGKKPGLSGGHVGRGEGGAGHKTLSGGWGNLHPRLKGFLIFSFLFTLGNSSNQFLLLRAESVGFDAASVILLYLSFNVVYSLLSYPAGRLSDRIGRRYLLIPGYAVYGLVYTGFAIFKEPAFIWGLFALYGIYHAFTQGVERALISEIAPPERKGTLLGLHSTLVGIGLFPASSIAGLLWRWFGTEAPF